MASYNEKWMLDRRSAANYAEHMFRDFTSMCYVVASRGIRDLEIELEPDLGFQFFKEAGHVGPSIQRRRGQFLLDALRQHNRAVQLALAMRRLPEGAREGTQGDRAYFAAVCTLYERLRIASMDVVGARPHRKWLLQDAWKTRHPFMVQSGMVSETLDPNWDIARDPKRHLRKAAQIALDELADPSKLKPTEAQEAFVQKYLAWNLGRLDEADGHLSLREPYHRDNWGWSTTLADLRISHGGQSLEVRVSEDDDDVYTIANMPAIASDDVVVAMEDPRAKVVVAVASGRVKIGITSGNGKATRTVRVQGA